MEELLLRIAMCAPCHQGEGSLHLAHVDGPPYDARHSSFHPGRNSVRPTFHLLRISHIRNSIRPTFHLLPIFHIRRLTLDGRGRRFNFPDQTCPDPLIALTGKHPQPKIQIPQTTWLVRHSRFAGSISAHNQKANSDNTDDQVSILHSAMEFFLKLPDISDRLFKIFCFRYLMSKSPNSPCNPPIIGFLNL
uniref:Uncharacterized protein n=1 Tax=Vitis vinifera TaxID=29760 RepID=A5BT85_VITVI|nr:hypothetical protein VITISV_004862 [Vitis vinifera]